MTSTIRKFAVATSVAGALAVAAGPAVFAAGAHLSPANTVINGKLKAGTQFTFVGAIDSIPVTVSCLGVSLSGKTPASGLVVKLTKSPSFTKCTDSVGGADTVTTTGSWSLSFNSTGSSLALTVPKGGATFSSNALAGCVVHIAPTAPAKIKGTYNNVNTWTVKNSAFATSGTGCTTNPTATASGTEVFTPKVSVVP